MNTLTWILAALLVILTVGGLLVAPAVADEVQPAESAEASGPAPEGPLQALAGVLLGALLLAGVGCLLAVLRIIFPRPTAVADDVVRRLGTGRLLLTGVLPLVGVGLLGHAADATGLPAMEAIVAIVLALPMALLSLVGAMAAVPHVGAGLLRAGEDRSLLARSVTGAIVLGLATATVVWLAKGPGAGLIGVLLLGWFLGVGLGLIFRPRGE